MSRFGGVARRLKRVVDREDRLELPEAGTIEVSGHTLGETQRLVQAALRTQFRDVQTDISRGPPAAYRAFRTVESELRDRRVLPARSCSPSSWRPGGE